MSTQEQEIVETTEESRIRREVSGRQVGIIVGVLVLVLLLFWFLFLRGGGGGDETAIPEAPVTEPAPPTEPPDEKQPPGDRAGNKGPVETFEVFAPRDPFEPLIDLTQGGGTDAGDTEGDTGDAGDGTDTDGDGDVDSEDGSPTDTGDSENVEGHTVELVATLEDGSVQIRVDDTVYTVEEGENFAQNFQLVSVTDDCATVLFGDDQFTICEGQEILK
ncbi:MAG: hypothetical protein M3280_03065 [Actinomycetota bacterium]|nr:hypothetical protein [Actinomycetota bacterium]